MLIDSGAFSEFTSGVAIDLDHYAAWAESWHQRADAIAGLDDLRGDWRRSLKNYERFPHGFPTYHFTDPDALLPDLVALCQARRHWLGFSTNYPGVTEVWVRSMLDRLPPDLHVHAFAGGRWTWLERIDSADSRAWTFYLNDLKATRWARHLSHAERLDIIMKWYRRYPRRRSFRGSPPEAAEPFLEE